MTRILTLSGSPAVGSSTDLLLAEIANEMVRVLGPDSAQVARVKLNELTYIPCQACGKAPTEEWCFFQDAITPVLQMVADCDCLLVGSPVYFDSVSGQLKMFIDRCNCFRPYDFDKVDPDHDFIKRLDRKRPGAMVLIGFEEHGLESARRTIAGWFKWVEVTNEGMITYASTDDHRSGTVADDPAKLAEARALGAKLAEKLKNSHAA